MCVYTCIRKQVCTYIYAFHRGNLIVTIKRRITLASIKRLRTF